MCYRRIKREMSDDYRKADPNFVGFVPRFASEAIDLFYRFKRLGLRPEHHPETFVWCGRALDDEEGARFEEWIVAPGGVGVGNDTSAADAAIEEERLTLLREAEERDRADNAIAEEFDDGLPMPLPPLVRQASGEYAPSDDEKLDPEMVAPSER